MLSLRVSYNTYTVFFFLAYNERAPCMSYNYYVELNEQNRVVKVKYIQESFYVKSPTERGPFTSLGNIIDHCERTHINFTPAGTRSLLQSTLREISSNINCIMKSINEFN